MRRCRAAIVINLKPLRSASNPPTSYQGLSDSQTFFCRSISTVCAMRARLAVGYCRASPKNWNCSVLITYWRFHREAEPSLQRRAALKSTFLLDSRTAGLPASTKGRAVWYGGALRKPAHEGAAQRCQECSAPHRAERVSVERRSLIQGLSRKETASEFQITTIGV